MGFLMQAFAKLQSDWRTLAPGDQAENKRLAKRVKAA
jgi:hypothetical protein